MTLISEFLPSDVHNIVTEHANSPIPPRRNNTINNRIEHSLQVTASNNSPYLGRRQLQRQEATTHLFSSRDISEAINQDIEERLAHQIIF